MKIAVWLIAFILVLVFAPLFLELGAVLIAEVFISPFWKYFFYVIGGIFVLAIVVEVFKSNTPEAKQKGKEYRDRLKGLKGQEYLDELEKIKNEL